MTKIIGVNEWSDVTLLEDGDKINGGEEGLAVVAIILAIAFHAAPDLRHDDQGDADQEARPDPGNKHLRHRGFG